MGVDVYGRQPTTPQGRYFGTNWSGWHSLVDYCTQIAPELTRQCTHWGSNDGDGLSGPDSQALAARLQAEIDANRCTTFAKILSFQNDDPLGLFDDLEGLDVRFVRLVQEFATFLRGCGGFQIW